MRGGVGFALLVLAPMLAVGYPGRAAAQIVPVDDAPTKTAPPEPAPPAPVAPAVAPPPPVEPATPPSRPAPLPLFPRPGDLPPAPTLRYDWDPRLSRERPPITWNAPPTRFERRPVGAVIGVGLTLFGAAYVLSAEFGGYVGNAPLFFVPIIGPVLYVPNASDSKPALTEFELITDSLLQAAGVAMVVIALAMPQRVAARLPVNLAPTALVGGGAGLAASGRW